LPHPLAADLEQLCRRVALEAGLELRAVQVLTHRIPMTVQVMVQRADGDDVSLDECAALSSPLGEALEAADLLDAPYVLEVSSPGIGEDLASDRDFTSFRGFPVQVVLREAAGTEAIREGLLLGRDERDVQLNMRGRTVRIPRADVVRVRLVTPSEAP
jgi:ribosome maturation factor RimP